MKTRICSFLAGIGLLAGTVQAQPPRIVLQGAGAPQVFTTINAALAAAQPNDKLYLSGGTFSSATAITIAMPLHFIGAGTGPDSTAVTATTSLSTTSGHIVVTTGASGSSFTGIRFAPAGAVQFGTSGSDDDATDIVFERCTFSSDVDLAISSVDAMSSTTFNECVFYDVLSAAGSANATLTRCVIDHQLGTGAEITGFAGGGLTMRHCVVFKARVGNSPNCIIENSVFTRTSAPFWQSNGAILTNNLLVSPALTSNMTPASAVGNVLGVPAAEIFAAESNNGYEWSDDLHLQPTSVGVGMATDGSDVGIYGSASPFKPSSVPFNPHFSSATVGSSTNVDSELPVNIRVIAQPN